MLTDALAPQVVKLLAIMILTMQNKQSLVFHNESFNQLCHFSIGNRHKMQIYFHFPRIIPTRYMLSLSTITWYLTMVYWAPPASHATPAARNQWFTGKHATPELKHWRIHSYVLGNWFVPITIDQHPTALKMAQQTDITIIVIHQTGSTLECLCDNQKAFKCKTK